MTPQKITDSELPKIRFNTQRWQGKFDETSVTLAKPDNDHGQYEGELVFTGQISDKCPANDGRVNKYGKYRDFVFYNKDEQSIPLGVTAEVLADFRTIHGEHDSKNDGPWKTFWMNRFKSGESIPVFYHESSSNIRSMGLAFMYKLAYEHSIAETIGHSNPLHHYSQVAKYSLEAMDGFDLPELMLGTIDPAEASGGKESSSLKSRVSFGLCTLQGDAEVKPQPPTILNGPKATYFPNYLQQPGASNNKLAAKKPYTTYMDAKAEVRGWKRYPVKPLDQVRPQALEGKQKENTKVQVVLNPLDKGVQFTGKVRFHNLQPQELGALLWALQWGGNSDLKHSLGMGKPFGYGQVDIQLTKASVFHNSSCEEKDYSGDTLASFSNNHMNEFVDKISEAYSRAANGDHAWSDSVQIKNLLAMANPTSHLAKSGKLKYMKMGMRISENDFVQAKKEGMALTDYANLGDTVDDDIFHRQSGTDLERKRETKHELKEKQAEQERHEKELAQLSPVERGIQEVLDATPVGMGIHLALIKALEKGHWEDADDQHQVAEHIRLQMQENNLWREKSTKKNRAKDKPHQVTLRVLEFL